MNSQQKSNMKFIWRFDPARVLDSVEMGRFEKVTKLLGIEDGFVIDSYTMSAAGPVLESIFVVGGGFLVEIKIQDKYLNFDVAAANVMLNYRVKYSEYVQSAEPSDVDEVQGNQSLASISIGLVKITISHTENLGSEMTYFGSDLDDWVGFCMKAYPITHLNN